MLLDRKLSIGSLIVVFPRQVSVTWGLTIFETGMLAALPLLMGLSIDGLLAGDRTPFFWLLGAMVFILGLAVGRRLYDTRAYGAMRVELGAAVADYARSEPVSTVNARLNMSRELVDFLEAEAPVVITAVVQVVVSILVLWSFHPALAASAGAATAASLAIYGLSGGRFFRLNRELNEQAEQQVSALETRAPHTIRTHLSALRRHEIRLSDTEALVYGLIFVALLAMLSFNLWFAAVRSGATPGQIFSIVVYSYEFMESAVTLPAALQSLTRLSEITQRINPPQSAQSDHHSVG